MSETSSRIGFEHATLLVGHRRLDSVHGPFDIHFFRDQARDRTAMAITCGDLGGRDPLLSRVHSSCVTSECLMARDCDCAEQLGGALAAMARAGRGVVFYLMQEGRGAGLTAKARDRMMVQASRNRLTTFDAYAEMGLPADLRHYGVVGPMARTLRIRAPLELLTNNPDKADAVERALADEKIEVRSLLSLEGPSSPFNRDYLRAKRRSGHALARSAWVQSALPPDEVRVEPPLRAESCPHLISTACYFLPVGLASNPAQGPSLDERLGERVDWFRLRVVYDLRTARESVLLSWRATPSSGGEAITLSLVDRLPGFEARGREALRGVLRGIRDRRAGGVVVHFDESNPRADHTVGPGGCPAPEPADLAATILGARWVSGNDGQDGPDAER